MHSLNYNGDDVSFGDSLVDGWKDSSRKLSAWQRPLDASLDEIETMELSYWCIALDLLNWFTVNVAHCSPWIPSKSICFKSLVSGSNFFFASFSSPLLNHTLLSGTGFEVKSGGFDSGQALMGPNSNLQSCFLFEAQIFFSWSPLSSVMTFSIVAIISRVAQ